MMAVQEKTDDVRQKDRPSRPIDALDRKLLAALSANADLSYADLAAEVGLSAPAVHERVKRLRADGRIQRNVALLDGRAIGKPLLAFVHVDTKGWAISNKLMEMQDFPELEEIHAVAGDTCMLLKVRVESSEALEGVLARLYALPQVISTRSYVVLSTYLERPVQGGISAELLEPLPVAD